MNKQELGKALQSLTELAQSSLFHSDFSENSRVQGAYANVLKRMDYTMFDKSLNDVIAESKYFPKPYEIQKAYNKVMSVESQKVAEKVYNDNCELCENRGTFLYQKKMNDTIYRFVARCVCERGNKYTGAPKIDEKINIVSLNEEAKQNNTTIQKLLDTRVYS